jgi:hypothetical protein
MCLLLVCFVVQVFALRNIRKDIRLDIVCGTNNDIIIYKR